MVKRRLGNSGLMVTPIGFGAFKIGRNTGVKYPHGYALPDDQEADRLLNTVLDMGINFIDTAPAYGLSEERIGRSISHRRSEYILSTKVGEHYEDQRSTYDFSEHAVRASVTRSLQRLRTDALDLVFIHSHERDMDILNQTDAVPTLQALRSQGLVRAIGLSGKTPEGAAASLGWADVLMVEYNVEDRAQAKVIGQAAAGVGVVVKKGLGSGRLDPATAIRFVLENPAVASLIIGTLNPDHIRENIRIAKQVAEASR